MGTKATSSKIEAAITRILEGKPVRIPADREFSIAAVAEEAALSNSTIHNRYPELAERIRALVKSGQEAQRKEQEQLAYLQRRLTQAQQVLRRRDDEIRRLRTVRLVLARELDALREELTHASHKDSDPAPGAQAGEHSG
ncbi:hypothetical protein [Cupriavidus basilensis]